MQHSEIWSTIQSEAPNRYRQAQIRMGRREQHEKHLIYIALLFW